MQKVHFNSNSKKNEDEVSLIFEQYKLLTESIHRNQATRESLNQFWIAVNSIGLTAISYIKESYDPLKNQIIPIIWFFIMLGVIICWTWINSLHATKKIIDIKNKLLIEVEQMLPLKIFTQLHQKSHRGDTNPSLTFREMVVPCLFLLGYVFYGLLSLYIIYMK